MAGIETNTKFSLHIRSNSLPTTSHPLVLQFEEHLQRLKGSEATPSSSTLSHKFDELKDLHDCIDKLFQLPMEQQALAQECNAKQVSDLLEGSLRLLDISSKAKDWIMQSKESMQELQSNIRRKRGDESVFAAAAAKYLISRKMIKKAVRNASENLKGLKNDITCSSSKDNNNTSPIVFLLKEADAVTLSSLQNLLSFISDPKGHSKWSRWTSVSKFMQPKRVASDSQESNRNEFEKVDAALQSLINGKPLSAENFQSYMENLEMCIQDLEIGFEQLSRKLIRNRVSLLNIFNH
ncbi:hypothetical protein PIB30_021781 [Stylosanthes scabra]|uniref:DUF241 domain protein n=1 Tax=Stylosanthes scabra TaxID=79078 RepID=A0ABU6VAI3_9FABA|nr:hypothetical protein [Stylosanthes scabra]